jgi:signal transduction histidine kinase
MADGSGRQRAFVSDAAHELRSPLASIRIQLEVAQRVGTPAAIDDLLIDLDRLSSLVEDLLLLARADADTRGPSNPTAFDTIELIAEIAANHTPALLTVAADTGPALWVTADRAEIRRSVNNLVDNAVRHAHTHVRLALSADPNTVTIHVLDDGPGIPENDRHRVFDRFTRLDTARDTKDGGTGLGLAIVELTRRSGGTVTLTDNPNGPGLDARLTPTAANPRAAGSDS